MDGARFDGIARQVGGSRSRRGMMGLVGAAAAAWLSLPQEAAARRRQSCQVACGGDKRLCKAECRNAPILKQCKKTCDTLRDQCFDRCQFEHITRRLVRKW